MAYERYVYNRINWKNKSKSLETPLGETNLNKMDSAIYNIAENLDVAYNELSTGKFDNANAGKVIVGEPTWNPNTGVLSFQFYDGTTFQVDFNVEKIPVSFSMDSAGVITMTTSDGTQWTANIGDVIPTYSFLDSDTIAFSDTKNGDYGHVVSAQVRKNSITGDCLQPNYLADIATQASKAAASAKEAGDFADNAAFDAKLAQSYAVGGSGVRQGEDVDNAKRYKELCQDIYDNFQQVGSVTGVKGAKEDVFRHGNVSISPENIGAAPVADKSGQDFNHITAPGLYSISSPKANAPTTYQHWSLIVTNDSIGGVSQMAVSRYGRDAYIRSQGGTGDWGTWQKTLMEYNVANNLVTTNAGYVLDARQGKILKDEMNGINTGLSNICSDTMDISITHHTATITFMRIGQYCMAIANHHVMGENWDTEPYPSIRIPLKFRPEREVYFLGVTYAIRMNSSGVVALHGCNPGETLDITESGYVMYKCAN